MDYYNDSYDYASVLESATEKIVEETDRTVMFLTQIRHELDDIVTQISDEYAKRDGFYVESGQDDYRNPEELPDFYNIPEDLAETNYGAWDRYAEAVDEYNEDTITLRDMIQRIQKATQLIGGLS